MVRGVIVKLFIKRCLILIKVFFKYGIRACIKRYKHFKDENTLSLEAIRLLHIVPRNVLEKQKLVKFKKEVKFSIITPLYNTPKDFLIELIESLRNQAYSNWELCLADGSDSEHEYVQQICTSFSKKDSRIVYHKLEENKGISENTNECIKLATGDYYGLLDHDDLLHPSALYEACKAINEYNADFIYTDEVKFSNSIYDIKDLKQFNFKPGFGADDLRSHNYICHFTVFSKDLLQEESKFYRSNFDGSQDHDMVLRLTEKAKSIYHINKVLYYWRVHENSVSMNLDVKSYAVDAAIRAVKDQLRRQQEEGTVMSSAPFRTIYRVEYPIKEEPMVSIVLWNIDDLSKVRKTIDIIKKCSDYTNLEFLYLSNVVSAEDNNDYRIIYGDGNISNKMNKAISLVKGKFILLLNGQLTAVTESWVRELLMHAQRNDVGTVGGKVYNRDGSVCCGGISLSDEYEDYLYHLGCRNYQNEIGYEAILSHVRNVTANSKNCMMFRKSLWSLVEGFSDDLFEYFDIDFCLKLNQKGYRNVWVPYSEIFLSKFDDDKKTEQQVSIFSSLWQQNIYNDQHSNNKWNELKLV